MQDNLVLVCRPESCSVLLYLHLSITEELLHRLGQLSLLALHHPSVWWCTLITNWDWPRPLSVYSQSSVISISDTGIVSLSLCLSFQPEDRAPPSPPPGHSPRAPLEGRGTLDPAVKTIFPFPVDLQSWSSRQQQLSQTEARRGPDSEIAELWKSTWRQLLSEW